MMPMGIASFSFDLFGLTRREAGAGLQPPDRGEQQAKVANKSAASAEAKDAPPHRDYEHVFWGMFPVL
ncbi:hypothetical protein HGO38_09380 [Rhizobium sp. CG5]|uniref:hypothetical protein n=1 Tax=Rhizobium sp. CG5 TaxID=2726076 RepID=UPI0020337C81|nr:hypothetical protein [Rhizobium sp. CG5]MCM2473689.1 hypothetical protein [Rhizobium sp. CG5]